MRKLRKGEIWSVGGAVPRLAMVITANMFNDLPDHPYVLAMVVQPGVIADQLLAVQVVDGKFFAEVDTIGRIPKELFVDRVSEPVDVQVLTDIHNRLFRILAVN